MGFLLRILMNMGYIKIKFLTNLLFCYCGFVEIFILKLSTNPKQPCLRIADKYESDFDFDNV